MLSDERSDGGLGLVGLQRPLALTVQHPVRFRPLTAGEVIRQSLSAYRRLFRQIAPIPLLFVGAAYVVFAGITLAVWWPVLSKLREVKDSRGLETIHYYGPSTNFVGPAIVVGVLLLVLIVLQAAENGALVAIVGQGYVGATPRWRGAASIGLRKVGALLWVFVILAALLVAGFAVVVLFAALLGAAHVAILGGLLVLAGIVAFVFIMFCMTVLVPVVVFEGAGGGQAIRRSFKLVRQRFWATVGVVLGIGVLLWIADVVCSFVFGAIGLGGSAGKVVAVILGGFVQLLLSAVLPVATAFLYFDLKNRAEGVDIEAVADRLGVQAGMQAWQQANQSSGPFGHAVGWGTAGYPPPAPGAAPPWPGGGPTPPWSGGPPASPPPAYPPPGYPPPGYPPPGYPPPGYPPPGRQPGDRPPSYPPPATPGTAPGYPPTSPPVPAGPPPPWQSTPPSSPPPPAQPAAEPEVPMPPQPPPDQPGPPAPTWPALSPKPRAPRPPWTPAPSEESTDSPPPDGDDEGRSEDS